MFSRVLVVLYASLLLCAVHARADTVDARCEVYPKGQDKASATVACKFSQRQGAVSIQRADGVSYELAPQSRLGNFLDQDRKLVFRKKGLGKAGLIFAMQKETVYVYWDTSGLAKQPSDPEQSRKTALSLLTLPPITTPFNRELQLEGIGFKVETTNATSESRVKITPSGLSIDNSAQEAVIGGQVAGADVGDLNKDGSPEVYVFLRRGQIPYSASLLAFSANKKKSLSQISIADLTQDPTYAAGYRGYDQFAIVEDRLVRRFPVFKPDDGDDQPSSTRQIYYKLVAGEASWQLVVDRAENY